MSIIMLTNGKFWEDVQHAANSGPLLGEDSNWKQEQIGDFHFLVYCFKIFLLQGCTTFVI